MKKRIMLSGIILAVLLVIGIGAVQLVKTTGWKDDPSKKALAEEVFAELEKEETKALLCAMYPLDSYEAEDFNTYLGRPAVKMPAPLEKGSSLLEFLEEALARDQHLEAVYVGISRSLEAGNLSQRLLQKTEDVRDWEQALLQLADRYPHIRFHFILEYPDAISLSKASEEKFIQLCNWYRELAGLFTASEDHPNVALFMPGAEQWLSGNMANYLENGQPNEASARFVMGQIMCMDRFLVTGANIETSIDALGELRRDYTGQEVSQSPYTLVFFGDSVIGNYTDSMSIPGVVEGFTGANVINCGYGGLSGAQNGPEDYSIVDMVDFFLSGTYHHLEENKAIRQGIPAFYALEHMEEEKLVFFFSLGLNDYMVGSSLKGQDEDSYLGAVTLAAEKLLNAYPQAQIVWLTPNYLGLFDYGRDEVAGNTLKDYVNAIQSLAEQRGEACIDVYGEAGIDQTNELFYLADRCHPNEYGRFAIGRLIGTQFGTAYGNIR